MKLVVGNNVMSHYSIDDATSPVLSKCNVGDLIQLNSRDIDALINSAGRQKIKQSLSVTHITKLFVDI